MARRDPLGIRLITRQGNNWSDRFPLIVEAVNHLMFRAPQRCCIFGAQTKKMSNPFVSLVASEASSAEACSDGHFALLQRGLS